MSSLKDEEIPIIDAEDDNPSKSEFKDLSDLPPSGPSLHKRRRGEPPTSLSVKAPQTPSDGEGASPCTAGLSPDDYYWTLQDEDTTDPKAFCEAMLERLRDQNDPMSRCGKDIATKTKNTVEAIEELERLLALLNQIVALKEHNDKILRRLRDVEHLKRLHEARRKIDLETQKVLSEEKELQIINEALDAELGAEYGQVVFDSILSQGKGMKRSGSKWKGHSRFGGSLLRKQRSRSAGGEDSDAPPGTPLRRRSEGIFCKEVEKSKVSKWTRVKAAFKWEKAQWHGAMAMGGAAGAVAAGALVGAVALAGSAPASATGTLTSQDGRDPSLTPRSTMSLTPNSSCEELTMERGGCRKSGVPRSDENDNTFLQAPMQDDSSTSPSPNKLHKTPWGKMRDIIQTRRESVRKKSRGNKSSPDVVPMRRRSLSDGGDSDAPPVLTLTIPSSEELESEPTHPVLRKQRSLELAARPPQHRPPRASKWSKVKRAFLTSASASVPSSPNRHSAFFTDAENEALSSGCEASGVREEIARDYAALQSRLRREFSDRQGKLYAAPRPVATEEQLSADFRKKLAEWQRLKGVRQPPPVPARQDLSDDFLKRWDEWKRMKETNSVPAWEEEAKRDEVLVQTSTGLFKFQGISRSFTRKLHEWEKSRGIAPEASTSALLKEARAKVTKVPPASLTRTQSDGSVTPSLAGSGRLHASSLSVNDADDFDLNFDSEHHYMEGGEDTCDGDNTRGAVLVEVEDEEVCTAAPLVAMTPRHTPQKPVYTYGNAEARLLCETSSAITGNAVLQPNSAGMRELKMKDKTGTKSKGSSREQSRLSEKNSAKRKLGRQPSIEEDAKFIRKTIEEIERGSSSRFRSEEREHSDAIERYADYAADRLLDEAMPSTYKTVNETDEKDSKSKETFKEYSNGKDENKRKDIEKLNGKKKSKSRARLERELSKPSESDSEHDVDTVTVEIPKRRKRPRRPSERPRTPPTSLHSDTEGEIFVLKLQALEPRDGSPEVIVKTTRKIFSPVMRSGETVPSAVIPVDVEDLEEVKPTEQRVEIERSSVAKKRSESSKAIKRTDDSQSRSKSSGDLPEVEEQKIERRNRPPLPLSPSSQRKQKETAPSIRIMIQRYNMKINEEGHTSGASSGASSPAWRSPAAERRRPPDMPVGVNIRNNPFLEREVQKSASACQLSRRDHASLEKRLAPITDPSDGVLKSRSANALHPEKNTPKTEQEATKENQATKEPNYDIATCTTTITDVIVPDLTKNLPIFSNTFSKSTQSVPNVLRQISHPSPVLPENGVLFERSISVVERPSSMMISEAVARVSERTAKIREARERFLATSGPMRREGTCSATDLRPVDRSSRISCESDVTEAHSSKPTHEESNLGRSASTGMVNVDREAWERVAEGRKSGRSSRSKFSLSRLAAKLRRKDEGAVSRLCRQSLLVQLRNKQ